MILNKKMDINKIDIINVKNKDFRVNNKERHVFYLLKPGEGKNYEQIRGYSVYIQN